MSRLIVIRVDRVSVLGALKRDVNRIVKKSLRFALLTWRRTILPQHFTVAGARKYGFRRRTRKYLEAKMRKRGHVRPLVSSGESERRSRRSRITTTAFKGVATINAPALNFRPKGGRIDMRDEVTRLTQQDERKMFGAFRKRFHERLRRLRGTRKTRRIAA